MKNWSFGGSKPVLLVLVNFRIPIFIITPTKAFISSMVTSCYHVEIERHCTGIVQAYGILIVMFTRYIVPKRNVINRPR